MLHRRAGLPNQGATAAPCCAAVPAGQTRTHLWPSTSTAPLSCAAPRSMAEPAMEPSSVVLPQPAATESGGGLASGRRVCKTKQGQPAAAGAAPPVSHPAQSPVLPSPAPPPRASLTRGSQQAHHLPAMHAAGAALQDVPAAGVRGRLVQPNHIVGSGRRGCTWVGRWRTEGGQQGGSGAHGTIADAVPGQPPRRARPGAAASLSLHTLWPATSAPAASAAEGVRPVRSPLAIRSRSPPSGRCSLCFAASSNLPSPLLCASPSVTRLCARCSALRRSASLRLAASLGLSGTLRRGEGVER